MLFLCGRALRLAFLIALAAQASLPPQPVISLNGAEAWGAVVQQVGIGLAIGFVVRLVFAAFELAGDVVGFQMGLNFAAFFDPSLNTQASATARFFGYMASLLFVVLNGHLMVLMAVDAQFRGVSGESELSGSTESDEALWFGR